VVLIQAQRKIYRTDFTLARTLHYAILHMEERHLYTRHFTHRFALGSIYRCRCVSFSYSSRSHHSIRITSDVILRIQIIRVLSARSQMAAPKINLLVYLDGCLSLGVTSAPSSAV